MAPGAILCCKIRPSCINIQATKKKDTHHRTTDWGREVASDIIPGQQNNNTTFMVLNNIAECRPQWMGPAPTSHHRTHHTLYTQIYPFCFDRKMWIFRPQANYSAGGERGQLTRTEPACSACTRLRFRVSKMHK